jgi:hypothetical protein
MLIKTNFWKTGSIVRESVENQTWTSKADNLTTISLNNCLENVGASMSHSPVGLHGLLQE